MTWVGIVIQVLGWVYKYFGANEEQLKKYQELIDRANREGKLSVEAYDKHMEHKKAIEEKLKNKQQGI